MIVERNEKIAEVAETVEEGIEMTVEMRILKEKAEKEVLRILLMTIELEADCDGRHCSCQRSSS